MRDDDVRLGRRDVMAAAGLVLTAVLLLLLLSSSTSPLTLSFGWDSAIYITTGRLVLAGRTPYVDFVEIKGPLIFFLEALGQCLAPGRTGAFLLQVLFDGATAVLLYLSARLYLSRRGAATAAVFSLLFLTSILEDSNLTEEYCLTPAALCLYLAMRQLPVVGVNMGHLGYLTQVGCQKPGEVTQMLDDLMAGQFQIEKRMMLKGTVRRGEKILKEDLALNEILISRREMPRILDLHLAVNGEPLCRYQADGMIIATPTGSTAYNLSAGGPIVEPPARMMILTPICPHDLNSRSIVLAAEDTVEIEIMGHDDEAQAVAFDGGAAVRLKVGDRLLVERSRVETVMVKLHEVSFVDHLRSRMAGR